MKIEIKKINLKTNTQTRTKINQNTVDEYAADLEEGDIFPAIILFQDGKDYYIGDGWHRLFAFKKAGKKNILADVKPGSKRDAVLYSVGSNAVHGLRRTNEDKRKAVTMLLEDKEWAQWSNREIARQCLVSENLVRSLKKESSAIKSQIRTIKVKRGGKEYTINTENIGRNAKKAVEPVLSSPFDLAQDRLRRIEGKEKTETVESNKPEFKSFRIFGWDIDIRIRKAQKKPKLTEKRQSV